MTTDYTAATTTPELGETVRVLEGLAKHYGRPLAKVAAINDVTITVVLYVDGTEHRITPAGLELIDRRLGVTELRAELELNGDPREEAIAELEAELKAEELALEEHAGQAAAELRAGLPLVVISCGKAKADVASPAAELYKGGYFTSMIRAARALTPDDRIRILSAKHGLLRLNEVVEPYDVTLDDIEAIGDLELGQQAAGYLYDGAKVVALCGRRYADRLAAAIRVVGVNEVLDVDTIELVRPLAGVAGIGEAKARLGAIFHAGRLEVDDEEVDAILAIDDTPTIDELPAVVIKAAELGYIPTNAVILALLELDAVVVDSSGYAYTKVNADRWLEEDAGETAYTSALYDLELIEVNGEPLPALEARLAALEALEEV